MIEIIVNSGCCDNGKTEQGHDHDNRYYTKNEIDNNIYDKEQSDDRFYTKDEIDDNHLTEGEITELFFNKTESDARYYTKGETYSKEEIDEQHYTKIDTDILFESYYTKPQTDLLFEDYYSKDDIDNGNYKNGLYAVTIWKNTVNYKTGDVVTQNLKHYEAILDNVNFSPDKSIPGDYWLPTDLDRATFIEIVTGDELLQPSKIYIVPSSSEDFSRVVETNANFIPETWSDLVSQASSHPGWGFTFNRYVYYDQWSEDVNYPTRITSNAIGFTEDTIITIPQTAVTLYNKLSNGLMLYNGIIYKVVKNYYPDGNSYTVTTPPDVRLDVWKRNSKITEEEVNFIKTLNVKNLVASGAIINVHDSDDEGDYGNLLLALVDPKTSLQVLLADVDSFTVGTPTISLGQLDKSTYLYLDAFDNYLNIAVAGSANLIMRPDLGTRLTTDTFTIRDALYIEHLVVSKNTGITLHMLDQTPDSTKQTKLTMDGVKTKILGCDVEIDFECETGKFLLGNSRLAKEYMVVTDNRFSLSIPSMSTFTMMNDTVQTVANSIMLNGTSVTITGGQMITLQGGGIQFNTGPSTFSLAPSTFPGQVTFNNELRLKATNGDIYIIKVDGGVLTATKV